MKKSSLALLMGLAIVSTGASANFQSGTQTQSGVPAQGGFQGPGGMGTIQNVAQAARSRDDMPVSLTGYIVQAIGDEKYIFKDSSGQIRVEVDDDAWWGINITPQTKITIYGEIDRSFGAAEIDVESIQIAQ